MRGLLPLQLPSQGCPALLGMCHMVCHRDFILHMLYKGDCNNKNNYGADYGRRGRGWATTEEKLRPKEPRKSCSAESGSCPPSHPSAHTEKILFLCF